MRPSKETSPGNLKIHNLTGIITNQEPYKVYHKDSPYHGNQCYKLQAVIEGELKREKLFVYPNLVSKEILHTIEQVQYIDKRYLLFCEKKAKGWVLHNWQELQSKGSDFNKPRQLNPAEKLENHEQEK